MNAEDLLFAKTHEWAHVVDVDSAKVATIGISAFAVEALTDLVFLDLPQVGSQVQAGTTFGEVESVKAVSDLYSPVTGEVIEVNEALPDALETLSSDPYSEGWIAKVRVTDAASLDDLMDHAAYEKLCAEEEA